MAKYQAPLKDSRFILNEVFGAEDEWAGMSATEEVNAELAEAILEEGARVTQAELLPINLSGDAEGARFEGGKVTTPKGFKEAYRVLAEGGWMGLGGNPEYGGQGMPKMLTVAFEEMLYATNTSFALYPALNAGACLAMDSHAPEAVKRMFLPRMYAGDWLGTMCLTEPHCGTDLGMIRTRAEPLEDNDEVLDLPRYRITGTKIWITGGEHDMVENIVHLVLAKLPDAPEGTRGISLFLVSKHLLDGNGEPAEANAVSCGSIEHKMGIKGSATCVMNFDGAEGVLIGEPHQGLAAMFTMMNYERLSIGLQGLGLGEVAYQSAMDFAAERLQSRAPKGAVAPQKPADPILVHPDVRRMALEARTWNETGRAFAVLVGQQLDRVKYHADSEVKAAADDLVQFLTPVAKALLTDRGFDATVMAQQLYGGNGYCVEWGAEQYVRDARIAMIYEGTNGIQAMDLVGRKLYRNRGAYVSRFVMLVRDELSAQNDDGDTQCFAEACQQELERLERVSEQLIARAQDNPDELGAAASDFLNLTGLCVYSYLWLRMARAAARGLKEKGACGEGFYRRKLALGNYFVSRILPRAVALEAQVAAGSASLMAFSLEDFTPEQ